MKWFIFLFLLAMSFGSAAQNYWHDDDYHPIYTAFNYLCMAPDARSTGLGDAGVASSPDMHSMYWNPAKYSFMEDRSGIAVSFSDYLWMKEMWKFNNDISLNIGFNTLQAYYKLNKRLALATSFTYFRHFDDIYYTDEFGNDLGIFKPLDINVDLACSYKFTNTLSAALATRYIYSRLAQTQFVQGGEIINVQSVAFDLAVYYEQPVDLGPEGGVIRIGADISNIGNKVSYAEDTEHKQFIPTNLRVGAGFKYNFSENHSLAFQLDANKLLVPTPPIYERDTMTGGPVYDEEGNWVIAEGMDPNVSVFRGMIQSWYDAPGGFREELHEWAFGGGFEYRYKTILALRSGLFYEHKTKGERRYFTTGAGFKFKNFGLDLGINIPIDIPITDSYLAVFYLRTSISVYIPGKH